MDRRAFLAGTAGTAALGLAGCLDRFETRSAWEQPPLVEDRPDAVYLPPAIEQMGTYGVHEVDGLRIGLFYTFPHRFWVVTGEDDSLVTIGDADVMHLMASVWDPDTGLVPPAEIAAEVRSGGERHQNYQLWPMLSQRMGFHYGDNVTFDEEGRYEIELRVDPTTARTSGAVDGVFAERASTVFEVEYASTDVLDLEFEFIDRDRRGDPGAVSLMVADHDHGEDGHDDTSRHDGDHEHPPPLQAPPGSALPGELYDLGSTGDARFLATDEQQDPGPEQDRKQRDELHLGEDVADEPGPVVHTGEVPVGRRVVECHVGHREHADVDDQDTQQCEPAENVEADDALVGVDRPRVSVVGLRGASAGVRVLRRRVVPGTVPISHCDHRHWI